MYTSYSCPLTCTSIRFGFSDTLTRRLISEPPRPATDFTEGLVLSSVLGGGYARRAALSASNTRMSVDHVAKQVWTVHAVTVLAAFAPNQGAIRDRGAITGIHSGDNLAVGAVNDCLGTS
jgi:hypothetical protein